MSPEEKKIRKAANAKKYYESHREEVKAKSRIYRDENHEKTLKSKKDWYLKCRLFLARYIRLLTSTIAMNDEDSIVQRAMPDPSGSENHLTSPHLSKKPGVVEPRSNSAANGSRVRQKDDELNDIESILSLESQSPLKGGVLNQQGRMIMATEEQKAYTKAYREKNKEAIAACKKKHYAENKEKILAKCKQWSDANKEIKAASDKAYREKNKDRIKQIDIHHRHE